MIGFCPPAVRDVDPARMPFDMETGMTSGAEITV
jgi:hypothetical protein